MSVKRQTERSTTLFVYIETATKSNEVSLAAHRVSSCISRQLKARLDGDFARVSHHPPKSGSEDFVVSLGGSDSDCEKPTRRRSVSTRTFISVFEKAWWRLGANTALRLPDPILVKQQRRTYMVAQRLSSSCWS